MIGVQCARCGSEFQADEQSAGKSEFCPVCGEIADVPPSEVQAPAMSGTAMPVLVPPSGKARQPGMPAPLFWSLAFVLVGGFLIALAFLFTDDWEAHHLQGLMDESNQAEAALAHHDFVAADRGFQIILDAVQGRKIQSEYLAAMIEQSRRDQARARAGLADVNQTSLAGASAIARDGPTTQSNTLAAAAANAVGPDHQEIPIGPAQIVTPQRGASTRITEFQLAIERFEAGARDHPVAFRDERDEWRRRQVTVWDLQYQLRMDANPARILLRYTCASQRTAPSSTRQEAEADNAFSFPEQIYPLKISSTYELIGGQWVLEHRRADPTAAGLNNIVSGVQQPTNSTLFERTGELEMQFLGPLPFPQAQTNPKSAATQE